MEVFIIHPDTEAWQGHLKYLLPVQDQHGFGREQSTTSALLQITIHIAVGFNQRKPPSQDLFQRSKVNV